MVYLADMDRVVEGYNMPFYRSGSAMLARNGTLSINSVTGPAKIEEVGIRINQVANERLRNDWITIILDEISIINSDVWRFALLYDQQPFYGPISAYQQGTAYTIIQKKTNLDYGSSGSISIKNTASPDPSAYYLVFWGRQGY